MWYPCCLLFPLSTCLLFVDSSSQAAIGAESEYDEVTPFSSHFVNALPSNRIPPSGLNSKPSFFKSREEERVDTLPVPASRVQSLKLRSEGVKPYRRSPFRSRPSPPSHIERLSTRPASGDRHSGNRPLMRYSVYVVTRQDRPLEPAPRESPTNAFRYYVTPNNGATEEGAEQSQRGLHVLPSGVGNDVIPELVENVHKTYVHGQSGDQDGGEEDKVRKKDKDNEVFEAIVSDKQKVWTASDNSKVVEASAPARFISVHRHRRASSRLPTKPATLDFPLSSRDRPIGVDPDPTTPLEEFPATQLRRYMPSENADDRLILPISISTSARLQQDEKPHLGHAAAARLSQLASAATERLCTRHALSPSLGPDLTNFVMKDLLCRFYLRRRLQATGDPLKRSHHNTPQLLHRHTRPADNVLDSKSNRWPSLYLLGGAMGR